MEGKYLPGLGTLVPHPPVKPPDTKPAALRHRHKLPMIRECAVREQRGIYSDIITTFKFKVKAQKFMDIGNVDRHFIMQLVQKY